MSTESRSWRPLRRLLAPTAVVAFAQLAPGCAEVGYDPILSNTVEIRYSPERPVAGDDVTVFITDNEQRLSNSEQLGSTLAISPSGILEHIEGEQFRALGAGAAWIELRAVGYRSRAQIAVACPTAGTATVPHSGSVEEVQTWKAEQGVHRVSGVLNIDNGSVIVGACARVEMDPGASIRVGENGPARLIFRGTTENPIVVAGAAQGGTPATWEGIRLHLPNASGSELRGLLITDAEGLASLASEGERAVLDIVGDNTTAYNELPVAME